MGSVKMSSWLFRAERHCPEGSVTHTHLLTWTKRPWECQTRANNTLQYSGLTMERVTWYPPSLITSKA